MALTAVPTYIRMMRASALSTMSSEFILAGRMLGQRSSGIMFRHLLPNSISPIIVLMAQSVGFTIMAESGLSFLGLGAQPPTAEWGNMMSGGRSMLQTYPWLVLSPGFAIFLTVVIFNLLGDTVRDYMDPKNSRAR